MIVLLTSFFWGMADIAFKILLTLELYKCKLTLHMYMSKLFLCQHGQTEFENNYVLSLRWCEPAMSI